MYAFCLQPPAKTAALVGFFHIFGRGPKKQWAELFRGVVADAEMLLETSQRDDIHFFTHIVCEKWQLSVGVVHQCCSSVLLVSVVRQCCRSVLLVNW